VASPYTHGTKGAILTIKRKNARRDNRMGAIYLRVAPSLLVAIKAAAKKDKRTVSDWVRVTLGNVLEKV